VFANQQCSEDDAITPLPCVFLLSFSCWNGMGMVTEKGPQQAVVAAISRSCAVFVVVELGAWYYRANRGFPPGEGIFFIFTPGGFYHGGLFKFHFARAHTHSRMANTLWIKSTNNHLRSGGGGSCTEKRKWDISEVELNSREESSGDAEDSEGW